MMGAWLYGIIVAAIFIAVIMSLPGSESIKQISRIAGALLLTVTILVPIKKAEFKNFFTSAAGTGDETGEIIKKAQTDNERLKVSVIANQIAQYIEERALKKGINCSVNVNAITDKSGAFLISSVSVAYKDGSSGERAPEVIQIIKDECGVSSDSIISKGVSK